MLTLLLLAAALAAPPADDAILAADLARMAPRLDVLVPKGEADPYFGAVVRHGRAAVPALLDMLDDTREMEPPNEVPLVKGKFTRGDVAFEALLQIVDVPWQELVPRKVKLERVPKVGFGAYYEYVRASPMNRKQIVSAVRKWYAANEKKLVYTELPGDPIGGYWSLPE
jgi:hypothetical protein